MSNERIRNLAPLALRFGLGFVFLWFGWSGITEPEMWVGLVPAWTNAIASAQMLVQLHGIFELVGGLLLITGIWPGPVAGLLFLNLVHTITLLSSGSIVVRDVGIAAALLSVCLAHFPNKKN